jgi:diguanylate cyclase (GGDEF)-like protein
MAIDLKIFSRIPSIPTVAVKVLEAFSDPDSSLDQIVAIIRNDPAIVGKLLKAANSAHYGSRGSVSDLKRAVMMLGRNSVTPLILSFSLAQQSVDSSAHSEHYRQIWLRSFVQATAAEVLGGHIGTQALRGECYTLNLLAGIGKLALLRAEPDRYLHCLERSRSESASLVRIEEQVLGFTHTELSGALLRQLGLPDRCVNPIEAIGKPDTAEVPKNAEFRQLVYIGRAADAVACLICDRTPGVAIIALETALRDLALPGTLTSEDLIGQVQSRVQATASLFDIDPPSLPSPSEMLQDALEQLSLFAVQAGSPDKQAAVPHELKEENGRLQRRVADLLEATQVDGVTGVYNRALYVSQLAERITLHRIRKQAIGLAVIDIDHFKKINDEYGHQAGDQVLKAVAQCLRGTLRETDLLARYGGEEFVILMDDMNEAGLSVVGERLRAMVENLPIIIDGIRIAATVSIGLTQSNVAGEESDFGKLLFAAADTGMYRAKKTGRNRFCVEPCDVSVFLNEAAGKSAAPTAPQLSHSR